MSQRVIIQLEDDLDGTEATETVKFGLDGVEYEMDLNDNNATRLRRALELFVENARRTGGRRATGNTPKLAPSSRSGASTRPDKEQMTAIRNWARDNGFQVGDKGRISGEIMTAWEKHNNERTPVAV